MYVYHFNLKPDFLENEKVILKLAIFSDQTLVVKFYISFKGEKKR